MSVTVSVTVVTPMPYGPGGFSVTVTGSPNGSEDPLSMDANAVQPPIAFTATFFTPATGGALFTVTVVLPLAYRPGIAFGLRRISPSPEVIGS